jgi:hypothetical protein
VFAKPIGVDPIKPINPIIKPGKTVDLQLDSISTDKKFGKGAGAYSLGGVLGRLQLPELKVPVSKN